MGVTVEWSGDQFENAFMVAVGEELTKAASIFRRNLQTVLTTTGKSPPPSPSGSKIPYNRTGTLARSWTAGKASKKGTKYVAKIGTGVKYALYLLDPKRKRGEARRNFLDGRLKWRRKTKKMILARLEAKRLVSSALRGIK